MNSIRAAAVLATVLATLPFAAGAQTAAPTSVSPIAVSNPFVIPWDDGFRLACITFSNASDKTIHAVRFGLHYAEDNPLDGDRDAYIDRVGTFSPGVAVRAPTRFLGTVDKNSAALRNCWRVSSSDVKTELRISVLKVVYADGTMWVNPSPSALASVTY